MHFFLRRMNPSEMVPSTNNGFSPLVSGLSSSSSRMRFLSFSLGATKTILSPSFAQLDICFSN